MTSCSFLGVESRLFIKISVDNTSKVHSLKGKVYTIDLLVLLIGLVDQLLLKLKTQVTFHLNEEVNCIESSTSISVPSYKHLWIIKH